MGTEVGTVVGTEVGTEVVYVPDSVRLRPHCRERVGGAWSLDPTTRAK
jgi:hypothetical protein